MRFYNITFFCDSEDDPVVNRITYDPHFPDYPITIIINSTSHPPGIILHMSEIQFIAFKNSILDSFSKYERLRKESLDE